MAAILADDNAKCIFLNENDRISIRISLKFVPNSPIVNMPALVQVMGQAITWTNADPIHLRKYATLGERWVNDSIPDTYDAFRYL